MPYYVNIRLTRQLKSTSQLVFEFSLQGISPYVLNRDTLLTRWAELPAPLGLSKVMPVSGPITGADKAVFFDKSFQQQRTITIAMLPILRQLPSNQAQNFRSKVF